MVTMYKDGTLVGLSSDAKPKGYDNGQKFVEMDTGKEFRYDANGKNWVCPGFDVASIRVKTPPTTTTYYEGASFNPTGMVIEATFMDGTKQDVTGYTFAPTVFAAADTKVTITYRGKTCEQLLTITPLVVSSIAVKTAPTKTAYTSEDNILTMAGLVITATYNSSATADIAYGDAGLTYSPAEGSTVSASGNVTITYADKTCTQAITYS